MSPGTQGARLIVVSNRLPIVIEQDDGQWVCRPGSGGLVTAMAPVLKNRGGQWIGWPGITTEHDVDHESILDAATENAGYSLKPVLLTEEEKNKFYFGFSNEIIWPLFHDLQTNCNFDPSYWKIYETVNKKFSDVIAKNYEQGDFIWVHDYHLINVAGQLREKGIDSKIGFFLHIPFPSLDIFLKLPWRFKILQAFLEYDLIGFQTLRDRRNFLQCIRTLKTHFFIRGKGKVIKLLSDKREIRVGAFPIGIDFDEFSKGAATPEVSLKALSLHKNLLNSTLILGVDRLDYTKGIPNKLLAFQNALERYPELINKITLIQVVVPSRENIPQYFTLKTEIEQLVGEINGKYTDSGWVPIHYIFRNLSRLELLSYYKTSEIALVTPLKDGMNLVAMEYCAASPEGNCTLILSEFAGAAAQLQKGALLVNPYDIEGMANAIYQAFIMPENERTKRMKKLNRLIKSKNIFHWVDSFLGAVIEKELESFPKISQHYPDESEMEYIPEHP
ncbi:MAG: trehalose-6-phosphate synthase [Nitrospinota bacterium]